MPRRLFTIAIVVVALLAAAYRLPALDARPMHTDEAVHAYKFDEFWKTGDYVYDPFEYHGPTLYYFTWPIMWLNGGASYADASETTFRLAPATIQKYWPACSPHSSPRSLFRSLASAYRRECGGILP